MSLVTVIATQSFTHHGQVVHKGEAVTLDAIDAAIYAQARRVTLDRAARATYRTAELKPAPVPAPVVVAVLAPESHVIVDPDPPPMPARRRRRTRRG